MYLFLKWQGSSGAGGREDKYRETGVFGTIYCRNQKLLKLTAKYQNIGSLDGNSRAKTGSRNFVESPGENPGLSLTYLLLMPKFRT